jgi:hypothetical protein
MAEKISIAPRKTHQYIGPYNHLDEWGTPIIAKRLAARRLPPDRDNDDMACGPSYVSRVISPRGHKDRKAFIRALEDEFTSWGCAHEHDCCGCANYRATGKHVRGREYLLRVDVRYNY